jgi:hypothetical protein
VVNFVWEPNSTWSGSVTCLKMSIKQLAVVFCKYLHDKTTRGKLPTFVNPFFFTPDIKKLLSISVYGKYFTLIIVCNIFCCINKFTYLIIFIKKIHNLLSTHISDIKICFEPEPKIFVTCCLNTSVEWKCKYKWGVFV